MEDLEGLLREAAESIRHCIGSSYHDHDPEDEKLLERIEEALGDR